MFYLYNSDEARTLLDSYIQTADQYDDRGNSRTLGGTSPQSAGYEVVQFMEPPSLRIVRESQDGPEEVTVTIPGIICDKTLPPVYSLASHKFEHVRYLRQFIRLTGLGSENFKKECDMFKHFESHFRQAPGVNNLEGFDFGQFEGNVCAALHARYFTERRFVRGQSNIPFGPEIDPNDALAAAQGTKFIRIEDNVVQYSKKVVTDNGRVQYEPLSPAEFKEGDIVEATGTFVAYPERKRGDYVLVFALRSLTMLSSATREAAKVKLKLKTEVDERKAARRKKVKRPTAGSLKRRYISYGAPSALQDKMRLDGQDEMRLDG